MKLTPVMERFVLHWGEMGTRWGVNRSVAQIHGLLYLSPKPLSAEEISETLGMARSNVSNSLRELQGWELVKLVHVLGDRRDHFEAQKDVQEIFNTIAEGRKQREIDPTLALLAELAAEAKADPATDKQVKARIDEMHGFVKLMAGWYDDVKKLPNATLINIAKMGGKIVRFLK